MQHPWINILYCTKAIESGHQWIALFGYSRERLSIFFFNYYFLFPLNKKQAQIYYKSLVGIFPFFNLFWYHVVGRNKNSESTVLISKFYYTLCNLHHHHDIQAWKKVSSITYLMTSWQMSTKTVMTKFNFYYRVEANLFVSVKHRFLIHFNARWLTVSNYIKLLIKKDYEVCFPFLPYHHPSVF